MMSTRPRAARDLARRLVRIGVLCGPFAVMVIGIAAELAASRVAPVTAAQDTSEVYKTVYNGWKWWHVYCYRCHGMNAVGSTLAPSLIEPDKKLALKEFLRKVRDGIPETAMQSWSKLLDDQQITQIYTYVMARTDKVLPPGRPDEVGPNGGPWIPPGAWPKQK